MITLKKRQHTYTHTRKGTAGIPLKSQKRINTLSKDNVNSQKRRGVRGKRLAEAERRRGFWVESEGCGAGKKARVLGVEACGAGRPCACAKTRVIRSTAAQLRYVLRYAFPKN